MPNGMRQLEGGRGGWEMGGRRFNADPDKDKFDQVKGIDRSLYSSRSPLRCYTKGRQTASPKVMLVCVNPKAPWRKDQEADPERV